MNIVFLLTGGNVGNRMENLANARQLIEQQAGKLVASSSVFETAAWGNTQQPAFLNQVLQVQTLLQPAPLLATLLHIERHLGRLRLERYGPRLIDIDILFYGSQVISSATLTIPHPQIEHRRFVLTPLQQLAANFVHPVLNKTVQQLLAECTDPLPVKLFEQ